MKGICRRIGTAPNQKAAATAEVLAAMLMRIPDTLTGKRDRALVALDFSGALRRSELVGLDAEDNLAAFCQRCHVLHDRPEHRRTLLRRKAMGDLFKGPHLKPYPAQIQGRFQAC
ncbi:hypothetical protein [Methylobacterium soli]|uniref:hypothetical protein n=1 Tax=Methylobacterium soli TaxID=553447 RepID=UPI00177FBAF5|nr:hypothetical protein [Methylobacterium soli]GJE46073.1 hypothetical protein AEGHOMDF_5273 [Methylobacterium soli]